MQSVLCSLFPLIISFCIIRIAFHHLFFTKLLSIAIDNLPTEAEAEFAFIEEAGAGANQRVNFYSDDDGGGSKSWDDIYKDDSLTCQQKVDAAKKSYSISQLGGTKIIPVTGSVPRWWYVTVSNCGATPAADAGVKLSAWYLHFMNKSGTFTKEFSMEEQGILEMSIFFLILFAILMSLLGCSGLTAKKRSQPYTVVQVVFISLLLEFIALIFNIAHYAKFAEDGKGVFALAALWYC